MIDSLLNLVFRCPHRRLTRPLAPITKSGQPHSQSYVVCLDCGKQFEYDLTQMRIGKAIDHTHDAAIMPPKKPVTRGKKVGYTLLAAVPAAVLLGVVLGKKNKAKDRKSESKPSDGGETKRES